MLGDFNFDNPSEYYENVQKWGFEDICLEESWKDDMYRVLNQQGEEDFTFTMPKTLKFPKWRPDKICMPILSDQQKQGPHFQVMDVQKVGWFCIPPFTTQMDQ